MKACRASRGTAPLIHNLGTSWLELGGQVHALSWETASGTHWVGLRAGLDVLEQREVSCHSLVTVPTEPPDAISCGTKLILPLHAYNKNFQTGSWPHPAPVQMVPDSFPRVRWPGRNLTTSLHLLLRLRMTEAYLCSLIYLHGVGMLYRLDTTYEQLTVGSVPQSFVCHC